MIIFDISKKVTSFNGLSVNYKLSHQLFHQLSDLLTGKIVMENGLTK